MCQHCPRHGDTVVGHTEKACPRGADIFVEKRSIKVIPTSEDTIKNGEDGVPEVGGLYWQGQERLAEEDQSVVKKSGRLPGGKHPFRVQQAERTVFFEEQQGGRRA